MRQYFEEMEPLGKPITSEQKENMRENVLKIREVEKEVASAIKAVGTPEFLMRKSRKGVR